MDEQRCEKTGKNQQEAYKKDGGHRFRNQRN